MGGKELGTPNRVGGKGSVLEISPEILRFMPAKIMTEFRYFLCQLPCLFARWQVTLHRVITGRAYAFDGP